MYILSMHEMPTEAILFFFFNYLLNCLKKIKDLLSHFFFCQINLIYLVQVTYFFEFLMIK